MTSFAQEAIVAIVLVVLFILPAYFLLPSYVRPLVGSVKTLLVSTVYVTLFAAALSIVLVIALVGEKAYRRWWLGQSPAQVGTRPTRLGQASHDEGPEALKRARRFTREARMDAVAERVIESFEQTSIGRELVRRRNRRSATKATPAATSATSTTAAGPARRAGATQEEAFELKDLSSNRTTGVSTARRRTPPPLPSR